MSSGEFLDIEEGERKAGHYYHILEGNVLDRSTYAKTTDPGSVQVLITTINPWGDSNGGILGAIRQETGDAFFSHLQSDKAYQVGDAIFAEPTSKVDAPFRHMLFGVDDIRDPNAKEPGAMERVLKGALSIVKRKNYVRVAITPIRCSPNIAGILGKNPGEPEKELVNAVVKVNSELDQEFGANFPIDFYFVTNDPRTKANLEKALEGSNLA